MKRIIQFFAALTISFLCILVVHGNVIVGHAGEASTPSPSPSSSPIPSASPSTVEVTGIQLDKTELAMKVKEQNTLHATVQPDDTAASVVTWESSNPLAATVDNTGLVTALNAGTTIITASAGGYSAACTCTVTEAVQAKDFVTRLYQKICLRDPSQTELEQWTAALKADDTASTIAYQLFFSDEYKNKNYCDEHYVNCLYEALLGRSADDAGLQGWMDVLYRGASRESVLNGFLTSSEFTELCTNDEIQSGNGVKVSGAGTVQTQPCSVDGKLDTAKGQFVARLYEDCLGRSYDNAGIAKWITALNTQDTASSVAYQFFFSAEYKNKNYCDEHYVKSLYEALLGRSADDAGLQGWTGVLYRGASRESVLNGFLTSPEFTVFCNKGGIRRGNGVKVSGAGTVQTQPCSVDGKLDTAKGQFVARLYEDCLGRSYDKAGLATWIRALNSGTTGSYLTYQFFTSSEFVNSHTSDTQYVMRLYKTLFDREPSETEKSDWLYFLDSGSSRYCMLQQLANHDQWKALCKKYYVKWEPIEYQAEVPYFYSQGDPEWSYVVYGSSTIGLTGCGPTAMAMIIQARIERTITPLDVAWYLHSIGLYNNGITEGTNGTSLVKAGERFGLSCEYVDSYDKMISLLKEGKFIAWQVVGFPFVRTPGSSHAIVLYGYDDGNIGVLDPNSGRCNGQFSATELWEHQSDVETDLDLGVAGVAF